MKPSHVLALAFVAAAVAWAFLFRRGETGRPPAPNADDDCAVSECGADGVPLSLYAG